MIRKKQAENAEYSRQKGIADQSVIMERLREKGYRITRQRQELLSIILEENCSSCKEIYYQAVKRGLNIGMATVYRMLNLLETIGALKWRNAYQICEETETEGKEMEVNCCLVELEDDSRIELSKTSMKQVLEKGMEVCGYLKGKKVRQIVVLREG